MFKVLAQGRSAMSEMCD